MKSRIGISVLCICILLAASGCGTGGENDSSLDEGMKPAAVTESNQEECQEERIESNNYYEEMMAGTEKSVAGNDTEESEGHDSGSDPVSGFEIDKENETSSDDSLESAAVTDSDWKEQTAPRDYYKELIAAARECVEGNVVEEPEKYYDFSYMIYGHGANYGASLGLGYLIEDIDGNGTDELIFGQNDDWNGVIYDLYTISDGELVHVFSGGERDRYYFCENGMIANEGADSAYVSVYAYYSFEEAEFHLVEAVIYNGEGDSDNSCFYSTRTDYPYDTKNMEPINREQAWKTIEKYVYECTTFIPFVEK